MSTHNRLVLSTLLLVLVGGAALSRAGPLGPRGSAGPPGLAAPAGPAAQQPGGLFVARGGEFSEPQARGLAAQSDDAAVQRRRFVDVDLALLGGADPPESDPDAWRPGTTLVLNFFDDDAYVAILERVERNHSGSFTWHGTIASDPFGHVTLVVKDGALVGNVALADTAYQIRQTAFGAQMVQQVDQSQYPEELPPLRVELQAGAVEQGFGAAGDDGSMIDMMVVYTAAARAAAGGTSAMESVIDLAVSETNTGYANSGITPRVRLVHTEEVVYTESSLFTSLPDLRIDGDGKMDNVHTLRDTYGADVVQLLTHNAGACGLGYLMDVVDSSFEEWAFAVTDWSCATGNYTFGHELGHNQGAHHDHYVTTRLDPSDVGAYAYSHGYSHIGASVGVSWRTVMAYSDECRANFGGTSCTRVLYFSNPDVSNGGSPTGIAEGQPDAADNRKTIDNTASTVANFRAEPIAIAPTNLVATAGGGAQVDLSWDDNSFNESGFNIYRKPAGGSYSLYDQVGANETSYSDTGVPDPPPGAQGDPTTFCYKVRAVNSAGNSAATNQDCASAGTPVAPSGLSATAAGATQIDLAWTDNSSTETSFLILRKISGGAYAPLISVAANSTGYSDTTVTSGTTYCYKVRSVNSAGSSAATSQSCATGETAPASPSGLGVAVGSASRLDLTWSDNSGNETSFRILRKPAGGSYAVLVETAADATAYSDNSVVTGTTYCYKVRAVNTVGASSASSQACETPETAPAAPSGLVATPVSANQIDLAWTDNSNNETEFRILRKTAGGSYVLHDVVGAGVTAYSDTTVNPVTMYCYKVRASNSGGYSAATTQACDATAPPP